MSASILIVRDDRGAGRKVARGGARGHGGDGRAVNSDGLARVEVARDLGARGDADRGIGVERACERMEGVRKQKNGDFQRIFYKSLLLPFYFPKWGFKKIDIYLR